MLSDREDVLNAFAVEGAPGRATLERYLRLYPEHAIDLIDLARELSHDDRDDDKAPLSAEDAALIDAAWARVYRKRLPPAAPRRAGGRGSRGGVMARMAKFEDLVGRSIVMVEGLAVGSESVVFHAADGAAWKMHHEQDCCESVAVAEVHGDPRDLLATVRLAEESSREATPEEVSEEGTWTFYRIVTDKGSVQIRWLGESNGYYGESVDFVLLSAARPAEQTGEEPTDAE